MLHLKCVNVITQWWNIKSRGTNAARAFPQTNFTFLGLFLWPTAVKVIFSGCMQSVPIKFTGILRTLWGEKYILTYFLKKYIYGNNMAYVKCEFNMFLDTELHVNGK